MLHCSVDEYLRLPYTIEVLRDDSDGQPGFVARVVELPGCITQADSFEELEGMIDAAMRAWIEVALDDGQPIPEPRPLESYSGKFMVRLPKSLHRQLADRDGVSLNALVNVALAQYVENGVHSAKAALKRFCFCQAEALKLYSPSCNKSWRAS